MHSFHQSRGRIFFEVLCALTISASFAGAWMQTGATALLAAAAVAALYGLIHMFDMRGSKPAEAVEPQRIDFEPGIERDLPVSKNGDVTPSVEDQPPAATLSVEEAEVIELAPAQAKPARRTKAPRKAGGRGASAPKDAKLTEPASPEQAEATGEAQLDEPAAPWPMAAEEAVHPHIEPLFEPEPFARMPRRAFGRRGRI